MTTQKPTEANTPFEPMVMQLPEWRGDLADDCTLTVKEWKAHVECMGDFRGRFEGESRYSELEYWYCCVYRGDKQVFHSGDAGGFITTGEKCRLICEAIIRSGLTA